jgi:hypothetical protein
MRMEWRSDGSVHEGSESECERERKGEGMLLKYNTPK